MKTKKIQRIVGEYLDDIADAAEDVAEGFDEEVIHVLRVNVKRLRAFLRCYRMFTGGAKPLLPRMLKEVYEAAGEIRDMQLMLGSASIAALPQVYRVAIEQRVAAAKDKWKDVYDAGKLGKKMNKLRAYNYKALPPFMPAEYIKSRLAQVAELRDPGPGSDEDLHTVRKQVKDIIYIARLVNQRWLRASVAIEHLPLQKLEKMAHLLGEFNDTRQVKMLLGKTRVKGALAADVAARRKVAAQVNKTLAAQRLAVEEALLGIVDARLF